MPIAASDFENTTGEQPGTLSARFDAERPFLFEGLEPRFPVRRVRGVFVAMRDDVRLSTDLHIPLGAALPLPVVLVRTPYNKNLPATALPALLPEQGIIYAIQDVRGRYESEGVFTACTGQDRDDGFDTVAWLAAQPWCNGSVGTLGSSYTGETAAKAAAARHPALKCCAVMFDGSYAGGESLNGAFLQGGVSLLRMLFTWFRDYVPDVSYGPPAHVEREQWFGSPHADLYATQPVRQPPVSPATHLLTLPVHDLLDRSGAAPSGFGEMMRRSSNPGDHYWRTQGFLTEADSVATPALFVTGPLERGSSFDNLRLFKANASTEAARRNQYLWFTPAAHSAFSNCGPGTSLGARDQGDTGFPYYRRLLDWFGHWLRGDPTFIESWPAVSYFLQGSNCWLSAPAWPPPETRERTFWLYGEQLEPDRPDTPDEPRTFRYDPADPTPSEVAGAGLDTLGVGYADRSPIDARADVLTYTTASLADPLTLAGPVRLRLHVSTDTPDTDFFAGLSEVGADGRAINIIHGLKRMRWRQGFAAPVFCVAGEIYVIELDLWHVAIELPAGNRLRVSVSSSHFPMHDRNLNTGGDNFTDTHWAVAHNTVHPGSALIVSVRE